MISTEKKKILNELLSGSSQNELIWINGFLNGILEAKQELGQKAYPDKAIRKITILFGTETGNSKSLATQLATQAKQNGLTVKLAGLDQYRYSDLSKEEYAFIVISTQGDGEPPSGAKKFYEYIHQETLDLKTLKYAVLALGDTAYPLFCKAGEDVDNQLFKLRASRIAAIQKCDTDYETTAISWFNSIIQQLGIAQQTNVAATGTITNVKKIYKGTVLSNTNLNDIGSSKETYHLEIESHGISYLPGDSLSIIPTNPAGLVTEIMALAGVNVNNEMEYKKEKYSLVGLLNKKLNITYLPERVVAKYATIVQQDIPATKISLLDLLKIYPVKNAQQFEEVVTNLEPIVPRLYSISSAPSAIDNEVHLTVSRNKFYIDNEQKTGLCSDYLSQFTKGKEFTFSVHPNKKFRLPAPDKDIIMIGPGTGIAPFRSFLAERDATGAPGKNWLFFGDQHFISDFLYQSEIQSWFDTGLLTKVSVAFSRDQESKIYVQHKIIDNGDTFYSWLEAGAYIYICGSENPMSGDVENAILKVIAQHGSKTVEEAETYLQSLKDDNRFLKDVY